MYKAMFSALIFLLFLTLNLRVNDVAMVRGKITG